MMQDSYEFWYDQGNRLVDSKDYAGAIAAYTQALEVPANSHSNQYQQRVQIWQTIVNLNIESDDSSIWLQHGLLLNKLGGYEESIASFNNALNIHPTCLAALCHQCHAFLQLKYYVKAVTNYCRVLEISPDYPELGFLAIAFNELRNHKFGELCQEVMDIQPEFPNDFDPLDYDETSSSGRHYKPIVQGNEYLKQGANQKAVESYRKVTSFPSCGLFMEHTTRYWNIVAWNNYGVALHRLGYLEQALVEYEKAATKYGGTFPKAWYNQGVVLEAMGYSEKAEISYTKALQLVQLYPTAWYRRGLVLEKLEQYNKAIESFQNAQYISKVFNNQEIEILARKAFERMTAASLNN